MSFRVWNSGLFCFVVISPNFNTFELGVRLLLDPFGLGVRMFVKVDVCVCYFFFFVKF